MSDVTIDLSTRAARIEHRRRRARWRRDPVLIDEVRCIECHVCVRRCPQEFGAVIVLDGSYRVVPELCSGCGKCVVACPVRCISDDDAWTPSPGAAWTLVGTVDDPYAIDRQHAAAPRRVPSQTRKERQ